MVMEAAKLGVTMDFQVLYPAADNMAVFEAVQPHEDEVVAVSLHLCDASGVRRPQGRRRGQDTPHAGERSTGGETANLACLRTGASTPDSVWWDWCYVVPILDPT